MTDGGVDALTVAGRVVRVRPVGPADADAVRRLYGRASEQSRYVRFFRAGAAPEEEVRRLVRAPDGEHAALLAEDAGTAVGVASFERVGPGSAEFAVFVDDARQGEGIGTLLLEHLAGAARRAGIAELLGDVLASNGRMLRVSANLSPSVTRVSGAELGQVRVRVPTAPDDATIATLGARNRTAELRSMRPLLAPESVAVIGAGRMPGGIGHEVLRALLAGGFTGPVYPVNPRADEVAGIAAYPSVGAIGRPVDLAVVAVPAGAVRDVVADCAAAGTRAAVLLTSGLGESGSAGARAQAELVRLARAHGMRLVGPNCLGVLNTDPHVRLTATFAPTLPPPGGLAVASQSGAVGIALLDAAARSGAGISSFVSLGNKADVSGNDLLAYWYGDPATRAVALYLESFGNPRRFAWVARELSRRKPVLAVKSGRSTGGQRAGASHTAAAAVPDTMVDTLFAQAGVIRTDTLSELLDAARLLVDQPLPAGDRLGVLGNAGGLNVLAADAAAAADLVVPELSAPVQAAIARLAPAAAGRANPVDLGAEANPQTLAGAVAELARSGEVDALVIPFVATRTNDLAGSLAALAAIVDDHPDLPCAVAVVGAPDAPVTLGTRRVPVYPLPEEAVRAMGRAVCYAQWRRAPHGQRPTLSGVDGGAAREILAEALAAGGGWQPADVAARLLACYRIPVIAARLAGSEADAVATAVELGYPVALKAADPELVHKSDLGVVRLGLADADEVRGAYRAVAAALGRDAPRVVVQPMADPGVEVVTGLVHDPVFGSVVMLGLGGVYTDLLADRAFRLLPLTDVDAARMWRSLRGAPLLTGYRGVAPADTAALEDLLLRVGRMAEDLPEVAELDLNPVLVGPSGAVAVDVKLRLAAVAGETDPYVRGLTEPPVPANEEG
ncbi:MAG TPA: GNAT family N-acetyltransferase [Pilimelia sp.]|nr:GNAT family N-acetyltransferase [Pilimelia sp.]